MKFKYPHTIENCNGEKIVFLSIEKDPEKGDKLILENFVQPNSGPPMHTHFLQDESLTVVSGKIGYQTLGEEPKYAGIGETVTFTRGTPHKFWNAGEEVLNCKGWVQPANSIEFFLSSLYEAQNKSGKEEPETFDGAYLLTQYSSEYDMLEIPGFVKKVIIPITYLIGKLLGKYKHFQNAPKPLKS